MRIAPGDAFDRGDRGLATRAAALVMADGVTLGPTDGPVVQYRFGVGVFEGTGFDASLLVPAARSLLEGRGILGQAAASDAPEVSPEVRREIERLGIRSTLSVPLVAADHTCGVMTAVRCGPVAFVQADLDALLALAAEIGDAIEAAWTLRTPYGWLTLDSAPIGMAVSALDGTFIEVNRSFAACLGWEPQQLVGRTFQSISHPDDLEISQRLLDRAIVDGSTAVRLEERYRRPDGSVVWADLSITIVRDSTGRAEQLISQVVDVTGKVEAELLLAHRASYDTLTGLVNRHRFTELVTMAVSGSERNGTTIAVLFLNLDRFQLMNESLGHEGGDAVLCEVARRLRLVARHGETVGRFGADVFALLCEELRDPGEAQCVAARVLAALREPVLVDGREVRATASVGMALGGTTRSTPGSVLLREAGAACSVAKARGGGAVAVFEEALRHRAADRMDVEAALQHAVSRRELRLVYQPVVNLVTGRLVGFEALLRWERPTLGLLAPEAFLQVAEESGLVVEIGHWALGAAAEQMGSWRRRWPGLSAVSMRVNVAARQLADPQLPDLVARAQEMAGPGVALCLEVTETDILSSTADASKVLAGLRASGVRVALDDLGTGYASLAYVAGLEADILKIDRSFTAGLGVHRAKSAVVAALIGLGRSLGQSLVAEGVETERQARILVEMGCEVAQGYLCGKPAAPEELMLSLEQAASGLPVFSFPAAIPR